MRDALRRCPWINFVSAVVSGTAKGADEFGERWAEQQRLEIVRYPADWATHGKRAGPMRNKDMADNAEGLVVVWDGESRGTESMIYLARLRGLNIFGVRTDTGETLVWPPRGEVADLWELAQERAAMMEFSGEMTREEAERTAGLAVVVGGLRP